jgi:PQQ-dependent catabolism-associated CXXCW motif protein
MASLRSLLCHRVLRALVLGVYLFASIVPASAQTSPSTRANPSTMKAAGPSTPTVPGRQPGSGATDAHRIALVIGNSAYASGALRNPVNDARAMAQTLQDLGFEVMLRENLGVGTFRSVIREFARRADAEDGIALFYYAGHAVSMDGRNYLLPVDIRPTDEEAIRDDSIDVDDAVMRRLEQSKKQVRLVILDSCRDNPFRSARTRSLRPGLAEMDKGEGSLIAFSTAPGRLAEDGEGQNSLFTGFLVAELRRGNDIESVFQSVRFAVADATNRRQVPWVNTSLLAKVYLRPDTLQPDAGAPARDASRETDDEQKRIDAAIAAAEKRRDAERQRLAEERARDKARIEQQLKEIQEEQERDRQARAKLEEQQRRQLADLATQFANMQKVIAETEQISRTRALTQAESQRVQLAMAETDALQRRASDESKALERELDAGRARDAERQARIAALASQAEKLSTPIAPQRPRIAADGTMFVRGVSLPKDVRLDPKDDSPPACKGFQGAWSGRWDGLRTVELWIEKIDRDCKAQVVYGRGGQSVNMEEPKYQRTSGKVSGNEMRIQLDDGAVIMLKQAADDRLSANWTREGRSAKCEMHRIGDDPAAATAVFAQEATDFGARPTRYLELPSPDKPLPMSVPGVSTITTLELKDLLEKNPNAVLIDAYHDNEHMTLPGAIWRPDIGDLRPGAFPLSDIKKLMAEATGNDLDRPIVVFERSSNWGWYGYNASLRLLGLGYTNVYWYRGGLDAWFDAGFQMAKVNNRKVVTQ